MFLGSSPFVFENFGGWTNAPSPCVDLNAKIIRLRFDFLEMLFLQAFVSIEIGNQNGIQFQRSGVIKKRRRFPIHSPDREIVETQLQFFRAGNTFAAETNSRYGDTGA